MTYQINVYEFKIKLYPENFALVRNFYEHTLGFPIMHAWNEGPDDKGVMFNVGGTILELLSPKENYQKITGCDISLEVDDVHTLWESMKDTQTIRHKLRHNNWNDTSFCIADPEGFEITFFTKDQ
jgi:uncharacterized glyoxalase superfamily protein PhnB